MIICYLAGPIDYESDKGAAWKDALMGLCSSNDNIGFFDPYSAFKFNNIDKKMAVYIHNINMIALESADIIVGKLMKGQSSIGTPIEFYRTMNKKPMVIMTDMADSVYMQYIGTQAILVDDMHKLYNSLLEMVESVSGNNNEMVEASSILSKIPNPRHVTASTLGSRL